MEAEEAAKSLLRLLIQHKKKTLTFMSYNEDGTERDKLIINWPTYAMLNVFLAEAFVYDELKEKSVQHAWGAHINYKVLEGALDTVQKKMDAEPDFGKEDGIQWSDGRSTRDIVADAIYDLLDFKPSDDQSMLLHYHNNATCYCEFCKGYKPGDNQRKSFNQAWRSLLKRQE